MFWACPCAADYLTKGKFATIRYSQDFCLSVNAQGQAFGSRFLWLGLRSVMTVFSFPKVLSFSKGSFLKTATKELQQSLNPSRENESRHEFKASQK